MYNGNVALAKASNPPTTDPIADLLFANLKKARDVIPSHLNPEKLARLALRTIRANPKLAQCTPASLVASIMEAAAFGLEIDQRGLAYLVPFWDKTIGKFVCTLMIGYKGLMEMAYKSGRVRQVYAEIVCQNDKFEYEMGLNPTLRHVPALGNRGQMVGVYAVAKLIDADPAFVVLATSDVDKVKAASKTKDRPDSIWNLWPEEMAKKTAIRRLCKFLPLSADMQQAIAVDEAGERGEPQVFSTEVEVGEVEQPVTPTKPVNMLNNILAGAAQDPVEVLIPKPTPAETVAAYVNQPEVEPVTQPAAPKAKSRSRTTKSAASHAAPTVQPTAEATTPSNPDPTVTASALPTPQWAQPKGADSLLSSIHVEFDDLCADHHADKFSSAILAAHAAEYNVSLDDAKRFFIQNPGFFSAKVAELQAASTASM